MDSKNSLNAWHVGFKHLVPLRVNLQVPQILMFWLRVSPHFGHFIMFKDCHGKVHNAPKMMLSKLWWGTHIHKAISQPKSNETLIRNLRERHEDAQRKEKKK